MVPYNQVVNGVTKYIDSEIVSKLTGWQRWAIGAGLGVAVSRGSHIMEQMRSMPLVKMLNIIDGDMVDVETIYSELRKQAERESINVALPAVGTVTFTRDDVEKVYSYIMGGAV